ncbi:hypothetical protein QOT17_013811 [Balamuthia mandrillaris]
MQRTNSVWDELPQELLADVFRFLELKHLCRCFTVNKRWSAVAQDNYLWSHFFRQHFGEEEAHTIEHQGGAMSTSWLQTFRERSENNFCFHPLLACKSYLIEQRDHKTIARDEHKGHCPKAVLSTERQLRQSCQWLASKLPAPPPEPDQPPHLIRGLQDRARASNDVRSPAFKQEQEEEEGKAMFMDWAGKAIEIEFRSKTRYWEIGLFHDQKSFHHFNTASDYFNSGIGRGVRPFIPFAAISLSDCTLFHRRPSGESGKIEQYPIDLPSRTSEFCTMVVTVDAREGKNEVRFEVDGKEQGVLPLPPHPFVMGFNTGYSAPDLTIVQSSILRS